jgi:hypothetical protein
LQTARYRGKRGAWQAGAAVSTPPLYAALGLSCRRLAFAGNEALGRWGLQPPRPPLSAALCLSCRQPATVGNETIGRRGLLLPHPRFPLRSACLADGPLPRATKRWPRGGCCSPPPRFRCARLVLQTTRYRGQRNACHHASCARTCALGHDATAASNFSRRCTNEMAVEIVRIQTDKVAYTASPTITMHRSHALRPPPPSPPVLRQGASRPGTHSKATGTWYNDVNINTVNSITGTWGGNMKFDTSRHHYFCS